MVECGLPKPETRVRFPPPAPFARQLMNVCHKTCVNIARDRYLQDCYRKMKPMKLNCLPRAAAFLALAAIFCLNHTARAQATRTWVSGVGDDANPGSRTAPCKTFAGAISKTATGGVIDVLDPGGFGGVTI